MMEVDEDDCDLDNDFIRKPKCFHSTPRLSSVSRADHNTKLTPPLCESLSPVKRNPVEYVNPFTPDGKEISNKATTQKKFKRLCISEGPPKFKLDESNSSENISKSDSDTSIDIPRRPRLREINVSRFNEEFLMMEEIGKGVHGVVYKCVNRMNGCIYAVKKTLHTVTSEFHERIVRNEIYALGVLNHQNILCNYSCWVEDGHAFIQNEYCDLGSLEEYLKTNCMSESQLRSLLLQIGQALSYMHSKGLAHMDIKPSNILLKSECSNDDDSGVGERNDDIIFKLGDFGHVASLDEESDIEEGDCRYLPREILEGNLKFLNKSDIFSLGLTVYEVAGGGPLPKNGDEWQAIRNGELKLLENLSKELNDVLTIMVHPRPEERPSASVLVKMLKISQSLSSPVEDDLRYMHQYYHNNTRLEHKVETTGHFLRELYKSHRQLQSSLDYSGYYSRDNMSSSEKRNGSVIRTRLVGKKAKRSNSTMF